MKVAAIEVKLEGMETTLAEHRRSSEASLIAIQQTLFAMNDKLDKAIADSAAAKVAALAVKAELTTWQKRTLWAFGVGIAGFAWLFDRIPMILAWLGRR